MKMVASEAVSFSELDSARFGIRAARARITADNLHDILEYCDSEKIDLLIARCPTSDIATMQLAHCAGFQLMDTLLYYQFDLQKRQPPECRGEFLIRSLHPGDRDEIRRVATAAFTAYVGHYHADAKLDRHQCDEAYASWAERSCIPGLAADEVFVAELDGSVAGFGTLRRNSSEEVEGLLFAVAPEHQGKGICGALMVSSLHWARSLNACRMIISTQLTNVSMQKVWCRIGFEPRHSFYTLHRWFER